MAQGVSSPSPRAHRAEQAVNLKSLHARPALALVFQLAGARCSGSTHLSRCSAILGFKTNKSDGLWTLFCDFVPRS